MPEAAVAVEDRLAGQPERAALAARAVVVEGAGIRLTLLLWRELQTQVAAAVVQEKQMLVVIQTMQKQAVRESLSSKCRIRLAQYFQAG
jgi:hypothetical protein